LEQFAPDNRHQISAMRWLQLILCALTLLAFGASTAGAHAAAHPSQSAGSTGAAALSMADVADGAGSHRPCKPKLDNADHAKCLASSSMPALPASLGTANPMAESSGRHWPLAAPLARSRDISPPFHPPKLPAA
jgi:hypothetical protein